jgi:O-methyltransferase
MNTVQKLYTDLLIRCISNAIYKDDVNLLHKVLTGETREVSDHGREFGSDWPSRAHSMAGTKRLTNLRDLAQRVIDERIPGDFIETGVWRGGCCILMRGVLAINDVRDRIVFVADSFQGLPKPNLVLYPQDENYDLSEQPELAVSLEQVKNNFAAYGLLDEQVRFIKGYFSETLPSVDLDRLALLRLDGDIYESTIVAMECLYPKLSPGGFVIVDDYKSAPPCKAAITDYRARINEKSPIHEIDSSGVWWRKPG